MTGGSSRRRSPPHILTLVLLAGISALSMNVFLPSLPGMAADFDVDYAVMQLSVSAYLGASAVLQLLAGPVSDRFGRRPVILWALAIFLLATIGTLLAPNATVFLLFRMVQAAVAAVMVLARAVIRDTTPDAQAASLIGYVTMGMSVVPMLAPILGGILDERFGWEANFLMMLLVGLAATLWSWHDLGETAKGGGVSLRAQIATYPALARSVRFWGYSLAATLASGSFFAYLGGAPYVGIAVFGLSPAQVGYYFAFPSLGYFLGNYLAGRFSARLGMNRMILTGVVLVSVSMTVVLVADLAGLGSVMAFFGAVAMMGIGNGMVLPNANAGMMSVRPELAGTASGLGGALAVAGGAGLAAVAGAALAGSQRATPLILVMWASAVGSVAAILWVIRREKAQRLRG